MKMTLTLEQIFASQNVLTKLVQQELPIKIAFRLRKIIKKIEGEFSVVEEQRQKLIQKYGEEIEQNGQKQLTIKDPQNLQKFSDEFRELLKETVEVEFEKMKLNDFPDNLSITTQEATIIEFIFDED